MGTLPHIRKLAISVLKNYHDLNTEEYAQKQSQMYHQFHQCFQQFLLGQILTFIGCRVLADIAAVLISMVILLTAGKCFNFNYIYSSHA